MDYILSFAVGVLVWKVYSLTEKIEKLKIQKEVGDRFTNANIDTLYKRTERIPTANDPDIQKYMATRVPFYMSLPTPSMYSPEELKALEKEYDKGWKNSFDYKERENK